MCFCSPDSCEGRAGRSPETLSFSPVVVAPDHNEASLNEQYVPPSDMYTGPQPQF